MPPYLQTQMGRLFSQFLSSLTTQCGKIRNPRIWLCSLLLSVQLGLFGCANSGNSSHGDSTEFHSSPPTPLEFIDKLKFLEGNN